MLKDEAVPKIEAFEAGFLDPPPGYKEAKEKEAKWVLTNFNKSVDERIFLPADANHAAPETDFAALHSIPLGAEFDANGELIVEEKWSFDYVSHAEVVELNANRKAQRHNHGSLTSS